MADIAETRERWNRRWSERGADPLGRSPSSWLTANRTFVREAPGRRALDIACGDGRNAVHLARLGFAVTAVDISDVAVGAVRSAAQTAGLAIDAQRLDLERDRLPAAAFDAVVVFNYLQRDLFPDLVAALAPGGILVAETFTRAHATELRNAVSERYLLAPGELRAALADLRLLRYREGVRHDTGRPRAVAGLVGRR